MKLFKQLFNPVITAKTKGDHLYEIRGYYLLPLFSKIMLYDTTEDKLWYCYTTHEYISNPGDYTDIELLRGRM